MVTGESKLSSFSDIKEFSLAEGLSLHVSVHPDAQIRAGIFGVDSKELLFHQKFNSSTELDSFIGDKGLFEEVRLIECSQKFKLQPEYFESPFTNSDKLLELRATLSYNESELMTQLKTIFPAAKAVHLITQFIQGVLLKSRFLKGRSLYGHLEEEILFLAVFQDGDLVSTVSESVTCNEDVLYHILSRIKEYKFDQTQDVVQLSGKLKFQDELFSSLSKYIKQVQINKGLQYQKVSSGLNTFEKQSLFPLINSFQCA